eukprot:3441975-Pleurochrysis_carterae.AAC.1
MSVSFLDKCGQLSGCESKTLRFGVPYPHSPYTHRLIVIESARLLIGVEASAVLRRLALIAVVKCTGVSK